MVAQRDGLFDLLGGLAGRARARPGALLVALLAVVAAVTTVLNLDTSAAFLTPVLVLAARRRGVREEPFLYGALLMSNAASLLLPGSNLTNLLVLANEHVPGAQFASRMAPAWAVAVAITVGFVVVAFRRDLRADVRGNFPPHVRSGPGAGVRNPPGALAAAVAADVGPALPGHLPPELVGADSVPIRCQPNSGRTGGIGAGAGARGAWRAISALAVAAAVVLMLAVRSPAAWVLAVGGALAALAIGRRAATARQVWDAVEPLSLAGVFGVAVALGALARAWAGPARLLAHAGVAGAAALGAVSAVALNNLPAAVLLGSRHPAHARALLLGLNLGPNLAVTGSLSALIWWRAAETVGARPSARRLSQLGIVLVPLSIGASALVLWLVSPGRL